MQTLYYICLVYISCCATMVQGGSGLIFNPMHWLKSRNLPATRSIYFVGVCIMPLIIWAQTNNAIIIVLYSLGWILGGIRGWGAYFDMGLNSTNRPEIKTIDWILYRTFGTMTAEDSYWYRFWRDYAGFFMRLMFYTGTFLFPLLYCAFLGQISYISAVTTSLACTAVFAALTPLAYGLYHSPIWPWFFRANMFWPEAWRGGLLMAITIVAGMITPIFNV